LNGGVTVQISTDHNLGPFAGPVIFNAAPTFDTLAFTNGTALSSSRNITATTNTHQFNILGAPVTLSGVISGSGGVQISGGGSLIMTGVNSYQGATVINANTTLLMSLGGSLPSGNAANGLTLTTGTATFNISGSTGTVIVQNLVSQASSNLIVLGGNTLQVVGSEVTSCEGVISGSGGLAYAGSGTLTLQNVNSYTGPTTIASGTLALGNLLGGASISSSSSVIVDGTFDISALTSGTTIQDFTDSVLGVVVLGSNALTFGTANSTIMQATIQGVGGALVKQGSGAVALLGNNSYTGGTTINAGTLQIGSDAGLGASSGLLTFAGASTLELTGSFTSPSRPTVLNAVATFQVDSLQTVIWGGNISGGSALTKTGAGTLHLSGLNSYASTIINAGVVEAALDSALGNVAGAITFSGVGTLDMLVGFSTARALVLNANGTVQVDVGTGTVSGLISGAGSLTSSGVATLALTNTSNSYTNTIINSGTLQVAADSILGNAAGTITFSGAGSLDMTTGFTTARAVVLNAAGAVKVDAGIGTLSGLVSGPGSLDKQGSAVLVLSNSSNSYAGGTSINAGVLQLTADGQLGNILGGITFNGLGTLEMSTGFATARPVVLNAVGTVQVDAGTGTLSGLVSGTSSFSKAGAGTLLLSNTGNSYHGGTIISNGTLQITTDANLGTNSGTVIFSGNGILEFLGSFASTLRPINLNSGAAFLLDVDPSQTVIWNGPISGANTLTKAGTGILSLTDINSYAGTIIDAGTLQIGSDANLGAVSGFVTFAGVSTLELTGSFTSSTRPTTLNAAATIQVDPSQTVTWAGVISGGSGLTKTGTGILGLSGINSYATTTINAGTLQISSDSDLGVSGGTLTFSGASTLELTGSFVSSARPTTLNAAATLQVDPLQVVTWAGVISGGSGLTKAGTGVLALSGVNSYAGTTISAGTLQVAADNNLGTAGDAITFTGVGTLDMTTGFATTRAVILGGADTLEVDAGTGTISGLVSGTGPLTKGGAATLMLSNSGNNYSGGTAINAGTLQVSVDSNLGAAGGGISFTGAGTLDMTTGFSTARSVTLNAAGTVEVDTGTGMLSGLVSGAGSLTKSGVATLALSDSSNSYLGGTTISGGTLQVSADGNLGAAAGGITFSGVGTLEMTTGFSTARAVALNAAGTVQVDAGMGTLSGLVSGGGSLIKSGAATLALSNGNSYLGGTIISAGTLQIGSDTALGGSGSSLTFSGVSTLELTGSFTSSARSTTLNAAATIQVDPAQTVTWAGLIGGGSSLTKTGSGILALNGLNSYASTTINAGTLQIGSDANLGASAGSLTFSGVSTLELTGSFTSSARPTTLNAAATFQVDPSQTVTWSGAISGGSGLTKSGSGTLSLSGVNSYATTTINAGILQVSLDDNLGTAGGGVTFSGASTLDMTTGFSTARTLTLNAAATVQVDGGTGTVSGLVSGAGSLTKAGLGTLILTATESYSGATIVSEGTLDLSGASSIAASTGLSLTSAGATFNITAATGNALITALSGVSGSIVTLGANSLNITGSSTELFAGGIGGTGGLILSGGVLLTLSGTNSYTGATTVSLGTLQGGAVGSFAPASAVTVAGGALVNLNSFSQTIGSLAGAGSVTLGSGTLTTGGNNSSTNFSGSMTGSGGLTKMGSSTFTLSGSVDNSGPTLVSAGTLQAGVVNAFSNASTVTVSGGAVLDLNNFNQVIGSLAGAGSVTLETATLTVGGNNSSNLFSGIISSTGGGVTKAGSGILTLSGVNSYSGPTAIQGGTLQMGAASAVPATALSVAVNAILDLNSFNLTLPSLTGSGEVVLGSATLTVNNSSADTFSGVISEFGGLTKGGAGTFTLTGVNTYSGPTTINLGTLQMGVAGAVPSSAVSVAAGATFDLNNFNDTIASLTGLGDVTLGSATLTLNGSSPTTFDGVISGSGNLIYSGSSIFQLGGTNLYTGATTISSGTLALASPAGAIATSTSLTVNGTFDVSQVASATIQDLLDGFGTISVGSSTLTLGTSASTTWSGVIQDGGLGGGSGGNVIKEGSGTLTLEGLNNFTGTLSIQDGVVNIANGAQMGTGHIILQNGGTLILNETMTTGRSFAINNLDGGVLNIASGYTVTSTGNGTGLGHLVKDGAGKLDLMGTCPYSGLTTVLDGRLHVNTTLTGSDIVVETGAVLAGAGTVTNSVVVNSGGTLSPGNSVGTITVGSLTFMPGSTYYVELNPSTASNTIVTASSVTIPNGVTLSLQPDPGLYSPQSTFVIMQDALGVSGTFSNVNSPFLLLGFEVEYLPAGAPTEVVLLTQVVPFSTLGGDLSPNAQAVSVCLDNALPLAPGSDLANIFGVLLLAENIEALNSELLQLQPSHLKGMSIVQENNSMQVNQAFNLRAQSLYLAACIRDSDKKKRLTLWGDAWGDFMHQAHYQRESGFHADTGGALLGMDYAVHKNLYLGLGTAYTYSAVDWNQDLGKGTVQSFYGMLYATWFSDQFFVNGALLGAYNHYAEKRNIRLGTPILGGIVISREATADFGGGEVGGYLSGGALFHAGGVEISPFATLEYYYLHQGSFEEAGAQSIDLLVKSSNTDLLRASLGLGVAKCYVWAKTKWIPSAQVAVMREERFLGSSFQATMKGHEACEFTVHGLKPSRTLVAPLVGITTWMCNDRCSFSLFYGGEFNANYQDQQVNLQIGYGF